MNELDLVMNSIAQNNEHKNKHTLSWMPGIGESFNESEIFALRKIRKGIDGVLEFCNLQVTCDGCPFKGICNSADISKLRDAANRALEA